MRRAVLALILLVAAWATAEARFLAIRGGVPSNPPSVSLTCSPAQFTTSTATAGATVCAVTVSPGGWSGTLSVSGPDAAALTVSGSNVVIGGSALTTPQRVDFTVSASPGTATLNAQAMVTTTGTVFHVGPDRATYTSPHILWATGTSVMANGDTVLVDACVYNDDATSSGTGVNISRSVFISSIFSNSAHCTAPSLPWTNAYNPPMAEVSMTQCASLIDFQACNNPVMPNTNPAGGGIDKGCWNLEVGGITIDHMAFVDCYNGGSNTNGAGIRMESTAGAAIALTNDYFYHNQNGILVGNTIGALTIDHSEFFANGTGACYNSCTHQSYIAGASVTITNSYYHQINVDQWAGNNSGNGSHIKSRAVVTTVNSTRVFDGLPGVTPPADQGSYGFDYPQGGTISMDSDQIEIGPNRNQPIIGDTGENGCDGTMNTAGPIALSNITFINDLDGNVSAIHQGQPGTTAAFTNLQLYQITQAQVGSTSASGSGCTAVGPRTYSGTNILGSRPSQDVTSPVH